MGRAKGDNTASVSLAKNQVGGGPGTLGHLAGGKPRIFLKIFGPIQHPCAITRCKMRPEALFSTRESSPHHRRRSSPSCLDAK